MRKKILNLTFGIVGAFCLLFSGIMFLNLNKNVVYADSLPNIQNVTLSGDILSWTHFSNETTRYELFIGSSGGYVNFSALNYDSGTNTYSINLKNKCLSYSTMDSGNLKYQLAAYNGSTQITEYSIGYYNYVNPRVALSTPTNLRWEGNKIAWDAVENADRYMYRINSGVSTWTTDTFVVCKGFETGIPYTFYVKAYPENDSIAYKQSEEATSPSKTFSATVTLTNSNVILSDLVNNSADTIENNCVLNITDTIPNAYYYEITVGNAGGTRWNLPINLLDVSMNGSLTSGTYNIDITVRDKEGAPLTNTYVINNWTLDDTKYGNILTGDVAISGTTMVGETLTATVTNSNNTGTLYYTWVRYNSSTGLIDTVNPYIEVDGKRSFSTSNTYTLTENEIGYKVCCFVFSSIENGSIESSRSAIIEAESSEPHTITVTNGTSNVNQSIKNEIITITANAPQAGYVFDNWTSSDGVVFANATSAETTFTMLNKNVTVTANYTPAVLTGSVNVSGSTIYGETLTANVTDTNNTGTLNYQWKRGVDNISGATSQTYTLTVTDIGKTISVVVTSSLQTGSLNSGATAVITKASQSVPTGITATACTNDNQNDGTIIGITANMEYKLSSASDWTFGTGATITGLTNGAYYVRYKETSTHNASENLTIIVNAFNAPTEYVINISNGTADKASAIEGATVTITANTAPIGKEFDKWLSSDSITFTSETSSTTTFTMPAKEVTITATYKNINYTISYNLNGGVLETTNPSTYTIESATIILNNPTKSGYTFIGWFDNDEFNGTAITEIAVGSIGNKTLYAKFEIIVYTISFNANGGNGNITNVEKTYKQSYTLPSCTFTAPEGKEFDGWAFSANGEKLTTSTITVEDNIELFAIWKDIETTQQPDSQISAGAVVGITLGSLVVLLGGAYFALGFTLYKKGKLTGKFFNNIYKWIKK